MVLSLSNRKKKKKASCGLFASPYHGIMKTWVHCLILLEWKKWSSHLETTPGIKFRHCNIPFCENKGISHPFVWWKWRKGITFVFLYQRGWVNSGYKENCYLWYQIADKADKKQIKTVVWLHGRGTRSFSNLKNGPIRDKWRSSNHHWNNSFWLSQTEASFKI